MTTSCRREVGSFSPELRATQGPEEEEVGSLARAYARFAPNFGPGPVGNFAAAPPPAGPLPARAMRSLVVQRPSVSMIKSAVSPPLKFCWPVTRLPSRMAKPFHSPAWM